MATRKRLFNNNISEQCSVRSVMQVRGVHRKEVILTEKVEEKVNANQEDVVNADATRH